MLHRRSQRPAARDTAATCPECEAHLAELCETCEWRLARAEEYDALARLCEAAESGQAVSGVPEALTAAAGKPAQLRSGIH